MSTVQATARALANVALVKYFGKRDTALNLPAAGSLSITLEPLLTTTTVSLDENLAGDQISLNGRPAPDGFRERVVFFMDLVRDMASTETRASVSTSNSFPTAAGLASSASGFAALTMATTHALGLDLSLEELSALARRGSGSAARSIPGGAVVWSEGKLPDGSDSVARTIVPPEDLDLAIIIGVSDPGPKKVGSTEAMEATRATSPYYNSWIDTARTDLVEATDAIRKGDIQKLGEITERSALAMHAAAFASRPGIVFWNGTTLDAYHLTLSLRRAGTAAWFTCDAGPQPKILCSSADALTVASALSQMPGIKDIIHCNPGPGARAFSAS